MRRSLVIALASATGIVVIVVVLFVLASASSVPAQLTYKGHIYGTEVAVTPIEVQAHGYSLTSAHMTIDGKAAYVSAGTPPRIVALATGHGGYDAYQLSN